MKILSAMFGMVGLVFIALEVPDYFPYFRLIMGMLVVIFTLIVIATDTN